MATRGNKVKDPAQSVTLRATIHLDAGKSTVECAVTEMSDKDARLAVPDADSIPDTFLLTFASGKVRRRCTVVSRELGQISVKMAKVY
jgi:hypothetical protein